MDHSDEPTKTMIAVLKLADSMYPHGTNFSELNLLDRGVPPQILQ